MTAFSPPLLGSGTAELDLALRRMTNSLSILHITAHPDDEDAHSITTLARSEGFRVGIYCLTRGESGENAVDHRAYESLGELRTEELLRAARWYGAEDVFFGPFYDYGFSKRIEEAFEKWGRQRLVREVVRAIRAFRPDIVLGRFRGDPTDGHAHHQAAGWATQEAFRLSPDSASYADLGLAPHKPTAYFALDAPNVKRGSSSLWEAVNSEVLLPPFGVPCATIAELGYAEHLSQTGGKQVLPDPRRQLYRCLARHKPHLGDARFGFRSSARLGISDETSRARYEQSLNLLTATVGGEVEEKQLEDALDTLAELAPNAIMRSRADELRSLILGRDEPVRGFQDEVNEPQMFYQPFPTVQRQPNTFSIDLADDQEVTALHTHGDAEVTLGEKVTLTFQDAAPKPLTRAPSEAVYRGEPPLLPNHLPSCIVESTGRQLRPVVARAPGPPHGFEVVRRNARLPSGLDIRRAKAPPDFIVGRVKRQVWYVPGYAECYASAFRAMGINFTECTAVPERLDENDTLMIGFRAYHAHSELADTKNRIGAALERGARVVVMAQTTEFNPTIDAPHEGELTTEAPEACEETQPVRVLSPNHPLFTKLNAIGSHDFAGWKEQYGSKFWTSWSDKYTPLIACADIGEPEQCGILLTSEVGRGRYTYCALALHLQLPHGHVGAYKLLANLLQS